MEKLLPEKETLTIPEKEMSPENKEWQFFWHAEEAWGAMEKDCLAARESIDFEQYILRPDRVGKRFLLLFMKKSSEGVRVRLLCDMVGSLGFYYSKLVKLLRRRGVKIRFFNPVSLRKWFGRARVLPRNHSKTMVIDGMLAYTGGVCFDERMHGWRDTHIRLRGEVVQDIQQQFNGLWQRHSRRQHRHAPRPFSYIAANPLHYGNPIYRELSRVLSGAKEYVWLTTPYFVPSRRLRRALCAAARRGVDVRLLISEKSDVRLADIVGETYFGTLLENGVKIYLYTASILHAKTALSDDDWATAGSMNLDHLSLFRNFEGNVIIREPGAIAELKERYLEDLRESSPVSIAQWSARPLWRKLLGNAGRMFKHML